MPDFSPQLTKLSAEAATVEAAITAASQAKDAAALRTLTKRHAELSEVLSLANDWQAAQTRVTELTELQADHDPEMQAMAGLELPDAQRQCDQLTQQLTELLNPADPMDGRDIIVEIRPAAGGDEAALFANELFRMYARFAERQNWQTQLLSSSPTGIGGLKEVIFSLHGRNVYRFMKYESGVHRVQRVPDTEKSGRVHTSTVTVAVVPEAVEQDLVIDPKDLKIVASTSSGAGGQSVNTTYSAIRLTHLPTGITVSMQDERSQTQNRLKAMQVLRSRLLARQATERQAQDSALRKSQIGTGDRSEKIRTYNVPQDRITDHRIKASVHAINQFLDGDLLPLLEKLRAADLAHGLHVDAAND